MTVEQFYKEIDGDFEEVLSRLGKRERIVKYLYKFGLEDESLNLERLLQESNYEEAFRCVHSIKGMCLNLGLAGLGQAASDLCEVLRNGAPNIDITDMLNNVKTQYRITIDAIAKVDAGE